VSTGAQYVVAVYAVIWFVLMLYVLSLAARTQRISREVELLARLVQQRPQGAPTSATVAEPETDVLSER
jgi:CcmD family protein